MKETKEEEKERKRERARVRMSARVRARIGRDGLAHNNGTSGGDKRKGFAKTPTESSCTFLSV
jgi:hypothetical protein